MCGLCFVDGRPGPGMKGKVNEKKNERISNKREGKKREKRRERGVEGQKREEGEKSAAEFILVRAFLHRPS